MISAPISRKAFWQAVGFIILSTLCLSGSAAIGKTMASFAPLPVVIAIRFVAPLFMILCYLTTTHNISRCWRFSLLDVYRGFCVVGAQYALFYVIIHANIMLATLLYATSGIFLPIISFLIYRIRIPKKTLASILISFAGVAISLNIINNHLSYIDIIGLFSGLLQSCSTLIQHANSKLQDKSIHTFRMYFISSVMSIIILFSIHYMGEPIHFIKPPHASFIIIILSFSVLSIGNQIFKSQGFEKVNKAASLVPFLYFVIPVSGLVDLVVFHAKPDAHMWVGAIIIMFGSLLMTLRGSAVK